MPVPEVLREAAGGWSGSSTLHMSWMPDGQKTSECSSCLTVRDVGGAYAVVDYDWHHDGSQQGTIIATGDDSGATTMGWSDTWHQAGAVMALSGREADCQGSYQVPGHPDWHWRIAFSMDGSSLVLRMYNVTPDGQEELAVEGRYTRV